MTNPTERPEERLADANVSSRPRDDRDSLDEIEERLEKGYDLGFRDGAEEWNVAYADLRTLINEVKERDRFHAESERQLRTWQDRTAAAEARLEQMEEALREIASYPPAGWFIHTDADSMRSIARAVLSSEANPSDTEEKA